jgi:hypothetical protein
MTTIVHFNLTAVLPFSTVEAFILLWDKRLLLPLISVRLLYYHDHFHLANVSKFVAIMILLQRCKQTTVAWDQNRITFV